MSAHDDAHRRAAAMWRFRGQERPHFAREPGPGQVSVWDFPRPPRLEREPRTVEVRHGEVLVARSTRALRVLETAGAPTVYVHPDDVVAPLRSAAGSSACEWKGRAVYLDVRGDGVWLARMAWAYPEPHAVFAEIADWPSFYPSTLGCFLDGERVRPQPGGFYGGWVTDDLAGPIKGEPGSGGW